MDSNIGYINVKKLLKLRRKQIKEKSNSKHKGGNGQRTDKIFQSWDYEGGKSRENRIRVARGKQPCP